MAVVWHRWCDFDKKPQKPGWYAVKSIWDDGDGYTDVNVDPYYWTSGTDTRAWTCSGITVWWTKVFQNETAVREFCQRESLK